MTTFWTFGFLLAIVVVAQAEKCLNCIYLEGQEDGATMRGKVEKELKAAGQMGDMLKQMVNTAMDAMKMIGFDPDKPLQSACKDPYAGGETIKTCETKTQCAKITGKDKKGLVNTFRGCLPSCEAGDKNGMTVSCCTGPNCNSAYAVTVNGFLVTCGILTAMWKLW